MEKKKKTHAEGGAALLQSGSVTVALSDGRDRDKYSLLVFGTVLQVTFKNCLG